MFVRVQHPALDEPIAEAVCIVADTDRLSVQVATSQRRVSEPGRLGRDVMVSNLIHTLVTSGLQLHAQLNVAADFVRCFVRFHHTVKYISICCDWGGYLVRTSL